MKLTLAAIGLAYLAILLCRHLDWTDQPDSRKLHERPIPLAGGLFVFPAFLFGLYCVGFTGVSSGFTLVCAAVFLIAVVDDRHHLHPGLRLTLYYVAGILAASWGGVVIVNVGNLLALGDIPLLWLAVPLTALSFAGLANAFNMVDGIDGLAGTMVAIPLGMLLLLCYPVGHPLTAYLTSILLPLLVFLCFNLGPDTRALPRIFLGDAGSVTLGFLVCAALVVLSQGSRAVIEPVTALWLVTLPLMDMLATMLRRLRNGEPAMRADRRHLHHTLLEMGMQPREVLLVLSGYAAACAAAGLALEATPAYVSLLFYFLLFGGHCMFVVRAERLKKQAGSTVSANATAEK